MKTSTYFWGAFFIFLGIFLTLYQFDILKGDYGYFFNFWPVILIIWGVTMLKIPIIIKQILAVLSALLLVLVIIGLCCGSCYYYRYCNDDEDCEYNRKEYKKFEKKINVEYPDGIKFSNLVVDGGACSINIADSTNQLIEAYSGMKGINFVMDENQVNEKIDLKLKINPFKKFLSNKRRNEVSLKLSTIPVWDFDVNIGAAEFNCDLSDFKVSNFNLSAGAADVELKLGTLFESTHIDIEAGASDITIEIPKATGCRIDASTGLSSNDFEGFTKVNNSYFSPDFEKATKKIFINIAGGVSDFEVVRY